MGKKTRVRKAKKSRATPYGRAGADKMIDDDEEINPTRNNNKLKSAGIMSKEKEMENDTMMDAAEAVGEGDVADEEAVGESRGKILRRHKMEWKNVRRQINDLKKSR